jgi:Zn-dependent protease
MSSVATFLQSFDLQSLISLLISVVSALLCITLHEMSHGFAALKLGDPTAKNQGRLTLNPIEHIDPIGLLMMIVARVGWAKPVPIDSRYFKHPKRDIAITAIAGPLCNFVLTYAALLLASLAYHLWYLSVGGMAALYVIYFLVRVAVLSVGLCLFNLIPISPLDGSKVLFALLPKRVYFKILKYERFGMILLLILVFLGVFNGALSTGIYWVLKGLCRISAFPYELLYYLM